MIGMFIKKYHIAIYYDNNKFIFNIINKLKTLYKNKIVIKIYNNPNDMFKDLNISKAKNKPFDLAIFCSDDIINIKYMILKHTCPNLPVITFKNDEKLESEISKFLT